MIAFDLIGYDGPHWIRIVGGRALYESVLVKDGYGDGNVRLARLEAGSAGIRQLNRYVDPDTPVELVRDDGTVVETGKCPDCDALVEIRYEHERARPPLCDRCWEDATGEGRL